MSGILADSNTADVIVALAQWTIPALLSTIPALLAWRSSRLAERNTRPNGNGTITQMTERLLVETRQIREHQQRHETLDDLRFERIDEHIKQAQSKPKTVTSSQRR